MPIRMKSSFSRSSVRRLGLYESVLRNGIDAQIPCSHCIDTRCTCVVSSSYSSRCAECIRLCRPNCDAFGVMRLHILRIANQCASLQSQLEVAEDEAHDCRSRLYDMDMHIYHLRRELPQWYRRLDAAIRRDSSSPYDLETLDVLVEGSGHPTATAPSSSPSSSTVIQSSVAVPSGGFFFFVS